MNFITKTGGQGKLYDIASFQGKNRWHQWMCNREFLNVNQKITEAKDSFSETPCTCTNSGVQVYVKGISGALVLDGASLNLVAEDLQCYQVYMSEIFSNAGYVVQLREVKEAKDGKTHWIIYMKPSIRLAPVDGRSDQLYGNIHLDLAVGSDQYNATLKLTVHRYADFRFTAGKSFAELLGLFS
ncbi:MAG: hypothetical protein LW630_12415 [Saprospiraceae bacterium]|nr:hypothetical protein [Saprospiraceae bacterium]